MAIKRVSELPSIYYLDEHPNLSDCILETSYDVSHGGHQFKSAYMTGQSVISSAVDYITQVTLSSINLSGNMTLSSGTLDLINNSSFTMNWGGDASGTSCYFHAGDMKLYSDTNIELSAQGELRAYGDPVVINDNLTVHTDLTETDNPVSIAGIVTISNPASSIKARTVSVTSYQSPTYSDDVVTCGLLSAIVGNINSILHELVSGRGVD